jgi:SAM-dependent methyltransferase
MLQCGQFKIPIVLFLIYRSSNLNIEVRMSKEDNNQNILEGDAMAWTNKDNSNYYENIPIELLQQYAVIGGFDNGCDVDVVYDDYIAHSKSIIDVGSGYGRVLQHLLDRGYTGKLIAIERSKKFYNFMRNKFSNAIDIFNGSVDDFVCKTPVDIVLWMWSNISEWPQEEQAGELKLLSSFCKPGGFLILDTISHLMTPMNVTAYSTQSYVAETEYGTAYGYIPSLDEIALYAKKIGAVSVKHIPYKTSTGRDRFIHILGF